MRTEYEAKFINIDKNDTRKKLKQCGAKLIRPEFLQKRFTFKPPRKNDNGQWLRVRDEGDKITLSLKQNQRDGDGKIDDQKEICLTVDSFSTAKKFLEAIGCKVKSYQETRRELWMLDGAEITIDEWPFLESLVEIEAKSEKKLS